MDNARSFHKSCTDEALALVASHAVLQPPATSAQIKELKHFFDVNLPIELEYILSKTNGCQFENGNALFWSVEKICSENTRLLTEPELKLKYMPLNQFFFFASDRHSNYYGFRILKDGAEECVSRWNSKDDSRHWVAHCILDFCKRFYKAENSCFKGSLSDDGPYQGSWSELSAQEIASKIEKYVKLFPPATEAEINAFEQQNGLKLPDQLAEFYKISNGLFDNLNAYWIYPLDKLTKNESDYWIDDRYNLNYDSVHFFGAEGNGDHFFFRRFDECLDGSVYEWDHESDDRMIVSNNLFSYIQLQMELLFEDFENDGLDD